MTDSCAVLSQVLGYVEILIHLLCNITSINDHMGVTHAKESGSRNWYWYQLVV